MTKMAGRTEHVSQSAQRATYKVKISILMQFGDLHSPLQRGQYIYCVILGQLHSQITPKRLENSTGGEKKNLPPIVILQLFLELVHTTAIHWRLLPWRNPHLRSGTHKTIVKQVAKQCWCCLHRFFTAHGALEAAASQVQPTSFADWRTFNREDKKKKKID